MYYYVSQTDIEQYLDITLTTNGINLFNLLRQPLQDAVDTYCNRTWNFSSPVTEYFDAFSQSNPPVLQDTFFPKYPISPTPYSGSYPRAGGINSITIGEVNGVGGTPLDLTYVFNYKTYFKFWQWPFTISMFNPLGYQAIKVVYDSDDAGNVPGPVKQALVEWYARKIQTSQDSNKDTKEVMTGNIRVYYKEDKLGEIPDFVRFVLEQYRRPPIEHF